MGDNEDVITLRLRNEIGDETVFKFRRATRMQKIFSAYASKKGLNESSLSFYIEGEVISPQSTADMLNLEDHDVVDVSNDSESRFGFGSAGKKGSGAEAEKEQIMEKMKSVIVNELEENLSSSISVQPQNMTVRSD